LAEKDRVNLAFIIFKREVNMPGLRTTQIGDLAFHPKEIKCFLKEEFNPATWNPPAPAWGGMHHNSREVALL
jgi:hypothetical protein